MSEHKHTDECGCGHDHNHEYDYITLSLDDDTELDCIVLSIFTVNDKDYIALQPIEGQDEDDNVFLYRYIDHEDGDPELLNIEDDDEFEAVGDAFDEMLDELEFDDMLDDEFDDIDDIDYTDDNEDD